MPAKHEAPESRSSGSLRAFGARRRLRVRLVALTLVFLRATREEEWASLLAAPAREAAFMLERLGRELELPIEGNIRTICDLSRGQPSRRRLQPLTLSPASLVTARLSSCSSTSSPLRQGDRRRVCAQGRYGGSRAHA